MLVNEPEQGSLSRVTSAAKILHRPSTFGKVKIPALSQKTRQARGTRVDGFPGTPWGKR